MRQDDFWTDPEIDASLNTALADLWNKLVEAKGARYYENPTPSTFSTVANTATYPLPADFLQLSRICVLVDGRERNLKRFVDAETDDTIPVSKVWSGRIYYVSTFTPLSGDGAVFDGINGFEEWATLKTSIKMKQASQQDVTDLMTLWQLKDRAIEAMKDKRDKGQPFRMPDVISQRPWYEQRVSFELPRYQLKNGVFELRERFA